MSASSPKTKLNSSIAAHSAFLAVAAMLALQGGCGGPVAASPAPAAAAAAIVGEKPTVSAASAIDAGRYLVKIGGCNDCHTSGYVETVMMTGKEPAEADWLMGGAVGFSGPWGVSYPANLRLSFQNMSEEQFLDMAHAGQGRPPMPWPSLQAMSDQDLKAIYAYVQSLGAKGETAPAALSPGMKPDRPHIAFVPQNP